MRVPVCSRQGWRWGGLSAWEPSVATMLMVPCHAMRATAGLLPEQGGMHHHRESGAIAARAAPADPELSATVCCRRLKAGRTRRRLSGTVLVCGGSAAHQLGDVGLRVGGYTSTWCFATRQGTAPAQTQFKRGG